MKNKVKQALDILGAIGLPKETITELSALTFLALANIRPQDNWSDASNKPMTIARGVMDFIRNEYQKPYKEGTRESVRKLAITPFLKYRIIALNPDNPNLEKHSKNTNYALTPSVLSLIKKYASPDWVDALKVYIDTLQSIDKLEIIKKIEIRNYKSILEDSLELGRINIFIGANGCGKTNILETIAFAGASKERELSIENLITRGVRVAKPSLTLSSFLNNQQSEEFLVKIDFGGKILEHVFIPVDPQDIYSRWVDEKRIINFEQFLEEFSVQIANTVNSGVQPKDVWNHIIQSGFKILDKLEVEMDKYDNTLKEFLIYDLNSVALRGLSSQSKKTPLGIYGESLDYLLSTFDSKELNIIHEKLYLFDWLDNFLIDEKLKGYKFGNSTSNLYFTDKYMQKKNNTFSAENANEGILHILFYLALFISKHTPKIFAIDNIETALNPAFCRTLIKELAVLSKSHEKQALITTQNPAILDGLDLFDDEQRLFEVYRTDNGNTKTRRIKFTKEAFLKEKKMKLSEMWMNGLLGAIPKNF